MANPLIDPAALRIIHFPHPTLRRCSKPVKRVDAELVAVVRRMFELMDEADGLGLAANQVNLPLRFFIANLKEVTGEDEEVVFINPVLSHRKGREVASEGCLSFPKLFANVMRPKQVRIQAYSLDGREINLELDGLFARVVQHETDHLDGVVFPDRMTPDVKEEVESDLSSFAAQFAQGRADGTVPPDDEIEAQLLEWEHRYC